MLVLVQKLGVTSQGAEVAEGGRFRAAHAVHQHHRVRHAVEVHGHGDLNEAAEAGPATRAGLRHVQVIAEVRGEDVAAIRDPVEEEKERV